MPPLCFQISCNRRLVSFEVYIDNPERVIECPSERGCAVSDLECELMLAISGFPNLSLGFLPQIFFPQRIVTIAAFTEKSMTLRFSDSVEPLVSGFESSFQHLNLFFELMNLNQTLQLQIFYCPDVVSAQIDESGSGMKIRFNQPVRSEQEQRCEAYFNNQTIYMIGQQKGSVPKHRHLSTVIFHNRRIRF